MPVDIKKYLFIEQVWGIAEFTLGLLNAGHETKRQDYVGVKLEQATECF